jgi:hypothetical protein
VEGPLVEEPVVDVVDVVDVAVVDGVVGVDVGVAVGVLLGRVGVALCVIEGTPPVGTRGVVPTGVPTAGLVVGWTSR